MISNLTLRARPSIFFQLNTPCQGPICFSTNCPYTHHSSAPAHSRANLPLPINSQPTSQTKTRSRLMLAQLPIEAPFIKAGDQPEPNPQYSLAGHISSEPLLRFLIKSPFRNSDLFLPNATIPRSAPHLLSKFPQSNTHCPSLICSSVSHIAFLR